jgi:phenylacetate-CoA ligase
MDAYALSIKHVTYPLWVLKNRSARLRYLSQLERSQFWSREKLAEHQWTLFKAVVTHAFAHCEYYKEKWRRAGIGLDDLRSPDDIKNLPTITKEEIQEHAPGMISARFNKEELIPDMTGGSTGSPLQFFYDTHRRDWREAAALRHDRWTGWDIGDRRAILWGAPRDIVSSAKLSSRIREHVTDRKLVLDASALDEAAMSTFARQLIQYRPKLLLAYANTLGLFARYVASENIQGIEPQAIITSAEVLTPENRALIEQTFRCPVYNRYGSREFSVIASECEQHHGMHVNAENLLVEVLNDKGTGSSSGAIVVTDLKNLAMPMIRYRINDVGLLRGELCKCSRGLPLLEMTGGRTTDFLTAVNGSKVSGIVMATYVITNITGIKQIQFVQRQVGRVTINVVKGPAWSARTLDELAERTQKFLGSAMQIDVTYLDAIPVEKSGKYRFSISMV